MILQEAEKHKIAIFLNKYPEVKWDRFTDDKDQNEICFYGWVERTDGKYDYLELAFNHDGDEKWYSTSSALLSDDFARRGGFVHNTCQRVENLLGNTVNSIKLKEKDHIGDVNEKTYSKEEKEIVICSAIKFSDFIQRGNRHCDCYLAASKFQGLDDVNSEEGFITSTGRFVDRFEAYKIQIKAGIKSVSPLGYDPLKRLFSEDLY
jgi:hypothetical protein